MAEPKEVGRLAADLREAGFSPLVQGTPGGDWEIAVEGEHVRATAGFTFRNGKTKRTPGTLVIDGQPHSLASSVSDLRRIWDEHEKPPVPGVLLEIPGPDGSPVPGAVQAAMSTVQRAAGGQFEPRCGRAGERWIIGFDLPGGDGLRLVFTRHGRSWTLDGDQPLQLVAGGTDRSAEAGGNLGAAMELLLAGSAPPDGTAVPGSPVRQQAARRDTGVETRRMVVIRE